MSLGEVAKRAGVSSATVSRVLNNTAAVKASTRQRVLEAITELGYTPNLNARSLAGGTNHTLGMILSNMENPFFFDVFRSADAEAHAHGFEIVVAHTNYEPERLRTAIRVMLGRQVAGLAVIVSEMDPDLIQELVDRKVRCVFYDVGKATRNISNIRMNYRKGVERTVDYLYALGHRRMAFIGHHAALGPTSERQKSFLEAAERTGIEFRTAADRDSPEGGRQAMRELLSSGFRPTAVLCVNDFMALGVNRELKDQGYRVPEDVSLTGFDGIALSAWSCPALTTVHIPRDVIGRLAIQALAPETIGVRPPGREITLEPELVVRESTGPARD